VLCLCQRRNIRDELRRMNIYFVLKNLDSTLGSDEEVIHFRFTSLVVKKKTNTDIIHFQGFAELNDKLHTIVSDFLMRDEDPTEQPTPREGSDSVESVSQAQAQSSTVSQSSANAGPPPEKDAVETTPTEAVEEDDLDAMD
jgi:hypothetical protein